MSKVFVFGYQNPRILMLLVLLMDTLYLKRQLGVDAEAVALWVLQMKRLLLYLTIFL